MAAAICDTPLRRAYCIRRAIYIYYYIIHYFKTSNSLCPFYRKIRSGIMTISPIKKQLHHIIRIDIDGTNGIAKLVTPFGRPSPHAIQPLMKYATTGMAQKKLKPKLPTQHGNRRRRRPQYPGIPLTRHQRLRHPTHADTQILRFQYLRRFKPQKYKMAERRVRQCPSYLKFLPRK